MTSSVGATVEEPEYPATVGLPEVWRLGDALRSRLPDEELARRYGIRNDPLADLSWSLRHDGDVTRPYSGEYNPHRSRHQIIMWMLQDAIAAELPPKSHLMESRGELTRSEVDELTANIYQTPYQLSQAWPIHGQITHVVRTLSDLQRDRETEAFRRLLRTARAFLQQWLDVEIPQELPLTNELDRRIAVLGDDTPFLQLRRQVWREARAMVEADVNRLNKLRPGRLR